MKSTPSPVVIDMVRDAKKRLQDHAQHLNDQREALQLSRSFWTEVKATTETPGWANYVEMVNGHIEKIRTQLEQPSEPHITDSLRGALQYLRQVPLLSSLAAASIEAVDQQEEALNADLDDFVEHGA